MRKASGIKLMGKSELGEEMGTNVKSKPCPLKWQPANSMPDLSRRGIPTTAIPTNPLQGAGGKYDIGATTTSLRLFNEKTVIGTWNVRTLHAYGKLKELTHELGGYTWYIIG